MYVYYMKARAVIVCTAGDYAARTYMKDGWVATQSFM
jgi:hypothetical protein